MAQIGSLGDIIFEVSDEVVRTFDEYMQKTAGRWYVHHPIHSNPRAEFLGPEQGEIEFTMRLSDSLGISPREEKEKIETLVRTGKHTPFMLANKPVSYGDWYVEACETTFQWINGKGEVSYADMILIVKEYY